MPISSYLDTLFQAPGCPSPATGAEWEAWARQAELQNSKGETTQTSIDIQPELLASTPFPSLLDILPKVGPSRSSRDVLTTLNGQTKRNGHSTPGSSSTDLVTRLRTHLTASSAHKSLISLLASPRPDEDLQLELVEILGFEGEGLQLVEELLKPGVRRDVVAASTSELSSSTLGTKKSGSKVGAGTSYLPSARLTFTTTKGKEKKQKVDISDLLGSEEDMDKRIREQLERPKDMFSADGPRVFDQEVLPNVYTSTTAAASTSYGGKYALPLGTVRQLTDLYEEVTIPPLKPVPPKGTERPVRIVDLPPLARGCFPKYVTLNRMQSIIQPTATDTNENLLICAPTGAGKTDVAIMSIIRVLNQYLLPPPSTHPSGFSINRDAFKVIYVAPMKALAAEITRKFSKRLAWLGIKVRELTGDMQLTRQEIAETQIIVTTPEKWDVVTRKPTGEGELASKVKLLIIDEVHLLNEERGAVIETIVARTLRQVESSQSLIRIVGLSATLPNYIDVSDFLRVNRHQGLFFFDASFRPVPLEQHFLGIAGKPRSQAAIRNMDTSVFEKVSELVQEGHQVMVFVHARKETVKSAQKLLDQAKEEAMVSFFETREHSRFGFYRREIGTSRNKEMKELFDAGFGIHHAGMLRSDRAMMERMFEDGAIKVLCCTSTLAWGVNLPAHAVVIKGTQVYDSSRGAFVDLSVLDVLQIFGRAGRPGYETSGVGYICTTQDKLEHYLHSIVAQHPIESKFIPGMVGSLNAEISLGTIANVQEAIQWLGYTYLFVRMRKEPFIYGMPHDEPKDDPQLGNKRNELITQSARQLAAAKMVRFDEIANTFTISDLGRIAAKYYLRYQTMEIFNTSFNPKMKNADLFAMLAKATEFDQIQIRENEVPELTAILESDHCPMEVKGGTSSKQGKVNILLQAHIAKVYLEDFALVADSNYVAQNAARIIRALLEIALSRNWSNNAILLIDLSKAIEKRMWPYEHPLAQITTLHRDTLHNLRQWADDTELDDLRNMEAEEIGEMIHMNAKHGTAVREAALQFPRVSMRYSLRPLAHDLLQISISVIPEFEWNAKISGATEPFYVWVQEEDGIQILQWRNVRLRPNTQFIELDFVIPIDEHPPESFILVSASDKWLGSDTTQRISLADLVMPKPPAEHTPLIDVPYLHISALRDQGLEKVYRGGVTTLNGIQSQAFWGLYHTQNNVLVSAPVGSGKSLLGELAIWHAFACDPDAVVMAILPTRHAALEAAARIRSVCPMEKGIAVQTLCSTRDYDEYMTAKRLICITTPSAFLRIEDTPIRRHLGRLSLVVLEDLHLLDEVYELTVTRTLSVLRPMRTRMIGLTASLNDPNDLADWLGVEPGSRYVFYPQDRGTPLIVSIKTFSIPQSSTLLKVMIKPAYDVIKASAQGAILFVPSRSACRTIATDLVTQSGTEIDLNGFLTRSREDVEPFLQRLKDRSLYEPLLHGIGYLIPGSAPSDLGVVLELFASGILRALIVPREACWTLPVRASTVIILSAQYAQIPSQGDRRIINYSRTELVKMQGYAVQSAHHTSESGRLFVMCQNEQAMVISRILKDGLPLESNLPAVFRRETPYESVSGLDRMIKWRQPPPPPQLNRRRVPDLRKKDVMDLTGWTYFAQRAGSNPTYYDIHRRFIQEDVSRLVDEWFRGGGEEYGPAPSLSGSGANLHSRTGSLAGSVLGPTRSRTDSVSESISTSISASRMSNGNGDNRSELNGITRKPSRLNGGVSVQKEVDGEAEVGMVDGEELSGTPGVPVE